MKVRGSVIALAAALCLWGCEEQKATSAETAEKATDEPAEGKKKDDGAKGDDEEKPDTKPASDAAAGASLEDAKKFVEQFVKEGADHGALTKKLIPKDGDYEAVFVADFAPKAKEHYEKMFSDPNGKVAPKEGQTEVVIWQATTEEIREGKGDSGQFPGGYKKAADKLKPGVVWFRFKFVKPGSTLGLALDGLTHVNGHWALFPKPWRVK